MSPFRGQRHRHGVDGGLAHGRGHHIGAAVANPGHGDRHHVGRDAFRAQSQRTSDRAKHLKRGQCGFDSHSR